MESPITSSDHKLQKCISESWKHICEELKNYCSIVQQGLSCLSLLVAHKTTLRHVAVAKIEDTEYYRSHSDIQMKLQHCIKMEIKTGESTLIDIVGYLQSSFNIIITQIEKIDNVYKSCNFSLGDITRGSEISCSFAEMLEALHKFKTFFNEDHQGRKYSTELYLLSENAEKIQDLWETSKLKSLLQDINLILGATEL